MLGSDGVTAVTIALLAAGLVLVARRSGFGGRLPGSFGQGFVGFRGDGWPHGVQEDDDASWTWSGLADGAGDVTAGARSRRPVPPIRPQR